MGTPGPQKINRYGIAFKLKAVQMSNQPGVLIKDVAESLCIHPFMLSRWRKEVRDGELVGRPAPIDSAAVAELRRLREVEQQFKRLRMEHDLLKNGPRGLPRPICVETRGAYTEATLGQWPLAFWRRMSPSKNLAQGKLRTQLWWHCA
jgi:transposase